MMIFKPLVLFVSVMFVSTQLWAQNPFSNTNLDVDKYRSRISEYFYSPTGIEILQPVKILGSVAKPGLYHLPNKTSITTLLSITGGTIKNANTKKIYITSLNGEKKELSLHDLMTTQNDVILKTGDIIYIPEKEHYFDQSTVNATTTITGIISLVLTAILVNEQLKN